MKKRVFLQSLAGILCALVFVLGAAGCKNTPAQAQDELSQQELLLQTVLSQTADSLFPEEKPSVQLLKTASNPQNLVLSVVIEDSAAADRKAQDRQFVEFFKKLKELPDDQTSHLRELHMNIHHGDDLKVIYDVEDLPGATVDALNDQVVIVDLNE